MAELRDSYGEVRARELREAAHAHRRTSGPGHEHKWPVEHNRERELERERQPTQEEDREFEDEWGERYGGAIGFLCMCSLVRTCCSEPDLLLRVHCIVYTRM